MAHQRGFDFGQVLRVEMRENEDRADQQKEHDEFQVFECEIQLRSLSLLFLRKSFASGDRNVGRAVYEFDWEINARL